MRTWVMLTASVAWTLVLGLAAGPACVLGNVDLSGKACPCASPYVCDSARNVCVLSGPHVADARADDAGLAPDALASREDATAADAPAPNDAATPMDASPSDAADAEPLDAVAADADASPMDAARDGGADAALSDATPQDAGIFFDLGHDCSAHAQCASGFCLTVVGTGTATQQFCSTPCSATSDCPIHLSCQSVNGMGFCVRESVFSPHGNFVTRTGGLCTQSNNTCQSAVCDTAANQCVESCTREQDCAAYGGNCWQWVQGGNENICVNPGSGSLAGAVCTSNSGCLSGICDRDVSLCVAHCCSNADCLSDEVCDNYLFTASVPIKVCRPRSLSAGTGQLGAPCTLDTDCASELCASVSASGGTAKQCSTYCCRDSDCSGFPAGRGLCRPTSGPILGSWVGTCVSN